MVYAPLKKMGEYISSRKGVPPSKIFLGRADYPFSFKHTAGQRRGWSRRRYSLQDAHLPTRVRVSAESVSVAATRETYVCA